jgi:hypothetical protein
MIQPDEQNGNEAAAAGTFSSSNNSVGYRKYTVAEGFHSSHFRIAHAHCSIFHP